MNRTAIFMLIFSIFMANAISQDIIFLKDGGEIKAKVEEINIRTIRFRKQENLSGPLYTILKVKVYKIKYKNGTEDVFSKKHRKEKISSKETISKEERTRLKEEQRLKDEQADRLNDLGTNNIGRQGNGGEEGSEGLSPGRVPEESSSYGLGNRRAIGQIPPPNVADCNVTSRIIVVIEIQVDRQGNVVSASVRSATLSDNCVWKVLIEAARRAKFRDDQDAPFRQTGWIKYTVEP